SDNEGLIDPIACDERIEVALIENEVGGIGPARCLGCNCNADLLSVDFANKAVHDVFDAPESRIGEYVVQHNNLLCLDEQTSELKNPFTQGRRLDNFGNCFDGAKTLFEGLDNAKSLTLLQEGKTCCNCDIVRTGPEPWGRQCDDAPSLKELLLSEWHGRSRCAHKRRTGCASLARRPPCLRMILRTRPAARRSGRLCRT